MTIVSQLKKIQRWSMDTWATAVDTAGPEYTGGSAERSEALQDAADECDTEYDHAIEMVESQPAHWLQHAREALGNAKALESDAGDASHATMALEALEDYVTEGGE